MAARKALPDHHHVMRFAAKSKRFHHPDTGQALGLSPAAFAIREGDEGGLSVTEIEFFGPLSPASLAEAAVAYRASQESKRLGPQGAFAWAEINAIKAAAQQYDKKVRVVHAPVDGNPAHAEIRHFTDDDLDLLAFFASDVFSNYVIVQDMTLPPVV